MKRTAAPSQLCVLHRPVHHHVLVFVLPALRYRGVLLYLLSHPIITLKTHDIPSGDNRESLGRREGGREGASASASLPAHGGVATYSYSSSSLTRARKEEDIL